MKPLGLSTSNGVIKPLGTQKTNAVVTNYGNSGVSTPMMASAGSAIGNFMNSQPAYTPAANTSQNYRVRDT